MQNQEEKQPWLEQIRSGEELANARKINEWLLPLLESHLGSHFPKKAMLLSVGCGFGADVDTLVDTGIDAYGVEPFARVEMWHLRKNKGRLIIADGRDLPFKDEVFDIVYSAEVIEHVGYEGQQKTNTVWIRKERERFAREVSRVLKPGGIIVLTTPNRHFCIDIGHGANFWGVRIHSPFHDFTLSIKDIKSLFPQSAGCTRITTLPYKNFITWSLYSQTYPIIRLLRPLIRVYLALLDRLQSLRSSFLSPYLILAISKKES